jgi:hypothetical protein
VLSKEIDSGKKRLQCRNGWMTSWPDHLPLPAIKNDSSGDGKRFVVRADEKLSGFLELERAIDEFAVEILEEPLSSLI